MLNHNDILNYHYAAICAQMKEYNEIIKKLGMHQPKEHQLSLKKMKLHKKNSVPIYKECNICGRVIDLKHKSNIINHQNTARCKSFKTGSYQQRPLQDYQ